MKKTDPKDELINAATAEVSSKDSQEAKEPQLSENEKDSKEIEELKKQAEDWKNKYLRALADYHNLENRTNDEKNKVRQAASRHLILKLLPFLDGLEKAEFFVKDPGLKMVKDSFWNNLQSEGLEEIEVADREYDPYTAEVIDLVKGDKDNIVVEVLRKGYKLNGEIIRVAQVKVSKKV